LIRAAHEHGVAFTSDPDFFGCEAAALKADPEKQAALKRSLQGQPVTLTLKCKQEQMPGSDEMRMKYTAASTDRPGPKRCKVIKTPADWDAECRNLLKDLGRYSKYGVTSCTQNRSRNL
jgi:hypothetical protein